jgi:fermentation-respiration switch protein FrsA (DUF1100 family)
MPQLLRHSAITLQDIIHLPESETSERLQLVTSEGALPCRYHPAEGEHAILWVFGAGGGLGGPAGGLYTRLGRQFREYGTASLELDYRHSGVLEDCIPDVLIGLAYLESLGKSQIALVGHSFGGAVVIKAGVIAALSSQTAGTQAVGKLSPKPVIFIHGEKDEILPPACSRDLHARAGEPKELILYPDCFHGLDQCREALDRDLSRWLRDVLA